MKDKIFRSVLFFACALIVPLTAGIIYTLGSESFSALSHFGLLNFVSSCEWNPREDVYGALPFIAGTLLTSVVALIICVPFSLSVALFNGEYFRSRRISTIISALIDLLAGIPSIVYGLWGFYALRPLIISAGINAQGFGVLLSGVTLAIMIIPYASSLSAEFIAQTPAELKEAAYSLGATQYETIRRVSLPVASSGIFAAYILAFGRALGETMAVTMLIGNTLNIPASLRDTGNTMASIIANQFGEANGLKLSSLFAVGLLLFVITAVINLLAKYIRQRISG
ncbi:MAG: phosphate ABC transporter permease subunit PstC [Prevotellaceae bacterium]|jgi:phosphate transport system permease protein|nr:phosphate ABC transporter permease subunit PstC [Prevotellaceae bacterium]